MQETIVEVLMINGPLKTAELALKLGKKRAKDIQKVLNKLLKRNVIMKSKVNSKLLWSLMEHSGNIDLDENLVEENVSGISLNGVNENICFDPPVSNVTFANNSHSFMEIINMNLKEEIKFLHKEIDSKNDLINSQQRIIDMLVTDQHQQQKKQHTLL